MMKAAGIRKWVIPGGHIPQESNGIEPEFLSQDRIAILNTGIDPARVKITVFYSDREPVSYRSIEVKGQRLRKIRINDLINPFPVFLETDYSIVLESDRDIIVQFSRMDTGDRSTAISGTIASHSDS